MVKNYLVSAVRPITDGWHKESNRDLYKSYQEMYKMSLASFKHFCQESFEAICWTDEVQNNKQYTIENWRVIRELWHKEPCNIFWAGADTIMTQPTTIFNQRFREYRLFNYTNPKSHPDFPHYYNNDIQWFPITMEPAIWELGDKLWEGLEQHPDRNWGFDQLRNNAMFWKQSIPDNDRRHPELAYQCFRIHNYDLSPHQRINIEVFGVSPDAILDDWNGLPIDQAHIIHFHGSRGSAKVIETMQRICQFLSIPT